MFATLSFIVKLAFLIVLFMALSNLGGMISLSGFGYGFQTSLGMFLILAIVALWILSLCYRVIYGLIITPVKILAPDELTLQKRGLQALAHGLSSVAAGDVRMAQYYTKRTQKYLKHDFGLGHLLSGLTARLSGDDKQANKDFTTLLDRPETSFIGLKALLKTAMNKGDNRFARVLIERAYAKHPQQAWILQSYFDLEIRTKNFENALALHKKMIGLDMIAKTDSKVTQAILYLGMGDEKKAYKYNQLSLPVALAHLKNLAENDKRRKSINVIKRLWAVTPHPDLLDYWIKYAPKKAMDNPHAMAAWIENLQAINSQSASGNLYCASALLRFNQTDHAKRFVTNAINIKPTLRAYQIMHNIDPLGGWMANCAEALHDKCWMCKDTLKIYQNWQILSNDTHFNTINWVYPDALKAASAPSNDLDQLLQPNLD